MRFVSDPSQSDAHSRGCALPFQIDRIWTCIDVKIAVLRLESKKMMIRKAEWDQSRGLRGVEAGRGLAVYAVWRASLLALCSALSDKIERISIRGGI